MNVHPANTLARLALGALIALPACVEPIQQTGSPATVESVGTPRTISAREASAPYLQVALPYVLCDPDLDDVDVDVRVCAGSACATPVQGFGSDGTVALPTRRCEDGGQEHLFVWDVCAGIIDASEGTRTRPDTETSYTLTIVSAGQGVDSDPFSLRDLDGVFADLEGVCATDQTE
jgi:hypothetical protein